MSRLQNAADAAAVAGAQKILTDKNNFSSYKSVTLVGQYPGKVSNQYRHSDESALQTITEGRTTAKKYASKNLSGNEDILVNSWTKNEVVHEDPILYEHDNNIYFVVQLKDTIQHFFLPGWFNDMDAPVTSVAMVSKNATRVADAGNVAGAGNKIISSGGEMPTNPSIPDMPSIFSVPDMPILPNNPVIVSAGTKRQLETDKNKNVIIGNWEVQNAYRSITDAKLLQYRASFGEEAEVYSEAWNFFQDRYNHYIAGNLYRTQTVNIFDDVQFYTDNDGVDSIYEYGKTSSVFATQSSINSDKNSSAYNPQVNGALTTYNPSITATGNLGLPYTWKRVDSLDIDFQPEVNIPENSGYLAQDWDLSEGGLTAKDDFRDKKWDTTGSLKAEGIKNLRIHTSINFETPYKVRPNKASPDVLWVRIESEPMLHYPDILDPNASATDANNKNISYINLKKDDTGKYIAKGITALNSVNQIIINANASNADTSYRPYIVFYDGPETNDVYDDYKSKSGVLHRKSLPVILNFNEPFRAIFYLPESPVIITGNAKDYFQGFVVAKSYMRLKNDNDFTRSEEIGTFSLPVYYAKDDTGSTKEKYYKTTDENGIEMFVDERGDIQFADFPNAPTNYGSYNVFGRTDLTSHGFDIPQHSSINMFLSS